MEKVLDFFSDLDFETQEMYLDASQDANASVESA